MAKISKENLKKLFGKAKAVKPTIQYAGTTRTWTVVDDKPAFAVVGEVVEKGLPYFPYIAYTKGGRFVVGCGDPYLSGEFEAAFEEGELPEAVAEAIKKANGLLVSSRCTIATAFLKNLELDISGGEDISASDLSLIHI